MKQNIFYTTIVLILLIPFQSSIYDIQFVSVQNNTVSMSAFSNKKILITTINSQNPNSAQLQFLDSLQDADTSLRVIAVPALDFGGGENNAALAELISSLNLDFVIMKATYTQKNTENSQHPLFKWLTDVNENSHFNSDVESIGQLFIISKSGILYSVLGNDVPHNILNQILNQNVVQ